MSNINIEMTTRKGVTLNTAQTFVDEDIGVIPKLQDYTVKTNSATYGVSVMPDEGYVGFRMITTPGSTYVTSGTYTATANGTYDVKQYQRVKVAIPEYDGTVNV